MGRPSEAVAASAEGSDHRRNAGDQPEDPSGVPSKVVRLPSGAGGLMALRPARFDSEGGLLMLEIPGAGGPVEAALDASVEPAVIETAIRRGERVIAQKESGQWVVLGVLRSCATPGVDVGDLYTIEAARLRLRATDELSLVSGAAQIALRAVGHVETIARNITARASRVQKIIGRMIHIN